ncbi:hypothetical protein B5M09_013343 [Aphanomyces astaci]|uniref:Uncharacterized protein n=1 Tax=Aphanomyces astaci TaxID=112090 RepID=A0A425DLJ3_APHAT|nr:hypothetical protein B5M09_013343 [Aphanomyces astaci]
MEKSDDAAYTDAQRRSDVVLIHKFVGNGLFEVTAKITAYGRDVRYSAEARHRAAVDQGPVRDVGGRGVPRGDTVLVVTRPNVPLAPSSDQRSAVDVLMQHIREHDTKEALCCFKLD